MQVLNLSSTRSQLILLHPKVIITDWWGIVPSIALTLEKLRPVMRHDILCSHTPCVCMCFTTKKQKTTQEERFFMCRGGGFRMSRLFHRKSLAFVLVALALVASALGSVALRGSSHAAGSPASSSAPVKAQQCYKGAIAGANCKYRRKILARRPFSTSLQSIAHGYPWHCQFKCGGQCLRDECSRALSSSSTGGPPTLSKAGKLLQTFDGVSNLEQRYHSRAIVLRPARSGPVPWPVRPLGKMLSLSPSIRVLGSLTPAVMTS